jgi:hypothetical protein
MMKTLSDVPAASVEIDAVGRGLSAIVGSGQESGHDKIDAIYPIRTWRSSDPKAVVHATLVTPTIRFAAPKPSDNQQRAMSSE